MNKRQKKIIEKLEKKYNLTFDIGINLITVKGNWGTIESDDLQTIISLIDRHFKEVVE